ncbi:MAG TPA: hypothetical protein VFI24_13375 [Pyrinomonadaceae bacterium]|nr:hypothetical protein [Pyrinomonadaceae bacterium]
MKRFLVISLAMLGLSISLKAQEHSARPSATPAAPSSTPAPIAAMDSAGWVKFTSDEGNFSVLVPSAPEEKSETTDSSHGPYTTHLFIVRGQTIYLIGWVDYDPSFNFNRVAELEANRDNFVKGLNAKLLSTRPTTIDGYSALEFTAETVDKIFKSRVYMVGRRPYQIVIGSPKGEDDAANVSRFFRSFKVSTN